jgi:hypothetical protein
MKAYQVVTPEQTHFEGTKPDAQRWVKDNVGKPLWADTTIREVDVQTDKTGVLAALNGEAVITLTERLWGITPRGGLKAE